MRAVIFDMDGLMIDSEKVYWAVGRQMAKEFGKTVSDQTLGQMMGRAPLESVAIYRDALGLRQTPEHLLEIREMRVQRAMQGGVEPMPGLFEVIQLLRPQFKLAIATSAPGRFLNIVLDTLNLREHFAVLQTSDDIKNGKPDPEIYLKVIAKLGVAANECFVLEDSSNGALAGKRADAYTIAIPTEHTRAQDFSFVDYVSPNLLEAAAHVRSAVKSRPSAQIGRVSKVAGASND
jgi:HAD superfamily hydrolase (TIGR01509 family)